jgi:hypothetical protein
VPEYERQAIRHYDQPFPSLRHVSLSTGIASQPPPVHVDAYPFRRRRARILAGNSDPMKTLAVVFLFPCWSYGL